LWWNSVTIHTKWDFRIEFDIVKEQWWRSSDELVSSALGCKSTSDTVQQFPLCLVWVVSLPKSWGSSQDFPLSSLCWVN